MNCGHFRAPIATHMCRPTLCDIGLRMHCGLVLCMVNRICVRLMMMYPVEATFSAYL